MYALFALTKLLGMFSKAAAISMGPLDKEMGEKTGAHLVSVLSQDEKAKWLRLREQRNEARDSGSVILVEEIDRQLMHLRVKAWVFNPALREEFLNEYFLDPPPDREVNKWIWIDAASWFDWKALDQVKQPLWICTGANDSVPVSQSVKIAALTPATEVSIYQECGHLPWLEHRRQFYHDLGIFLESREALSE